MKKLKDAIKFLPPSQDLKPEKFKLIIHLLLFLTIAFTDNTISILDKDVYIKHNESLVSGYLKN